ncbi:hypothetical protein SAMD00019534_087940 [Acytostelium subglobosum LB1]|uniref:hypothetical protein n=1 Tax=Acytostelium subglobosum LB1 TaxID=1410327 RepID=UPI000644C4A6|nr:hypothetical protein SAMD00019534_087940 [Acytostelium subglobosum LB1]GAM25619.1 hypothetical protein SAMD00019534_087940 [Acytostelium subglobosum LB1]|eukprot:XP_012751605.1 hypothetical protein SAMD00019534_087940 [Acytostelium subglobosum LB1]
MDEYGTTSYSRYSLEDGQCHSAPMPDVDEPVTGIAACYDGRKYIYLIGGYCKDNK